MTESKSFSFLPVILYSSLSLQFTRSGHSGHDFGRDWPVVPRPAVGGERRHLTSPSDADCPSSALTKHDTCYHNNLIRTRSADNCSGKIFVDGTVVQIASPLHVQQHKPCLPFATRIPYSTTPLVVHSYHLMFRPSRTLVSVWVGCVIADNTPDGKSNLDALCCKRGFIHPLQASSLVVDPRCCPIITRNLFHVFARYSSLSLTLELDLVNASCYARGSSTV